jgi:hypothetical protein
VNVAAKTVVPTHSKSKLCAKRNPESRACTSRISRGAHNLKTLGCRNFRARW